MSTKHPKDTLDSPTVLHEMRKLDEYRRMLENEQEAVMPRPIALASSLRTLYRLGNYREAIDLYSEVKDEDLFTMTDIQRYAALSMVALGKYSEAVELLTSMVDGADHSDNASTYGLLADAYEGSGDQTKATEARLKAQRLEIENTFESVALIESMIADDPDNADLYADLAENLAFTQDYPRAIEAIHKAVALDPTNMEFQAQLSEYEEKAKGARS